MLRIASTLNDVMRPVVLFDALGSKLKVGSSAMCMRGREGGLLDGLSKNGEGLDVLELGLEGKSDEVSVHFLRPHLFCAGS